MSICSLWREVVRGGTGPTIPFRHDFRDGGTTDSEAARRLQGDKQTKQMVHPESVSTLLPNVDFQVFFCRTGIHRCLFVVSLY